MVIHAGDWAYDLEDNNGQVGNDFFNAIQPIAATYPWMGAPGNQYEQAANNRCVC
jgi:hypothetical protein